MAKKKMYYKMRMKTVERSYHESVKKLQEAKEKLESFPASMLRKLAFAIKQVSALFSVKQTLLIEECACLNCCSMLYWTS